MTLEYVLLMSLFVLMLMGAVIKGPQNAFEDAGPKLGARVEKHLNTGAGFQTTGRGIEWEEE
jgi:hypothetical protein